MLSSLNKATRAESAGIKARLVAGGGLVLRHLTLAPEWPGVDAGCFQNAHTIRDSLLRLGEPVNKLGNRQAGKPRPPFISPISMQWIGISLPFHMKMSGFCCFGSRTLQGGHGEDNECRVEVQVQPGDRTGAADQWRKVSEHTRATCLYACHSSGHRSVTASDAEESHLSGDKSAPHGFRRY
jgi:hypothetical protein